jgi:transcriptional regulator with XRE-family HTH domain
MNCGRFTSGDWERASANAWEVFMEVVKYPELGDRLTTSLGQKSQRWLADRLGLTQGGVSRILGGLDRPRLPLIVLLAHALNEDPAELAILAGHDPVWATDLYTLHFLAIGRGYLGHVGELITESSYIRDFEGNAKGPLDYFLGVENELRDRAEKIGDERAARFIQKHRARLIYEILACYRQLVPNPSMMAMSRPWLKRLRRIAEDCDDDEMRAMHLLSRAHAQYLAGGVPNLDGANADFVIGLELPLASTLPVDDVRMTALQALAGILARRDDPRGVRKYHRRIDNLLQESVSLTDDSRALANIGTAISFATMGSNAWQNEITAAERLVSTVERERGMSPLLTVQIEFTKVYAHWVAGENRESALADLAQPGLTLASESGYAGFARMIERMVLRPKRKAIARAGR